MNPASRQFVSGMAEHPLHDSSNWNNGGEFRRRGFAEATFGSATRLTIRVKQPKTEHAVSVGKLQAWLDGGANSLAVVPNLRRSKGN